MAAANMAALRMICLLALVAAASANLGFAISTPAPSSFFSCIKANFTFGFARCWRSTGEYDTGCTTTLQNAASAGFSSIDAYMYPCFSCHTTLSASSQASALYGNLSANDLKYGKIWVDVDAINGTAIATNVGFINAIVTTLQDLGASVGIYTGASQWQTVTNDSTQFSSLPLWYAHCDGEANFGNFTSFGGWTAPFAKPYQGCTGSSDPHRRAPYNPICGLQIDNDYSSGTVASSRPNPTPSSPPRQASFLKAALPMHPASLPATSAWSPRTLAAVTTDRLITSGNTIRHTIARSTESMNASRLPEAKAPAYRGFTYFGQVCCGVEFIAEAYPINYVTYGGNGAVFIAACTDGFSQLGWNGNSVGCKSGCLHKFKRTKNLYAGSGCYWFYYSVYKQKSYC